MTQQRDTTQPAGGSPVERGVGRLEPERADFVAWLRAYAGGGDHWRANVLMGEHDIALAVWKDLHRQINRLQGKWAALRIAHQCMAPACPPDCCGCNYAISSEAVLEYAKRYAWLRERDLEAVHSGGVFAGRTPDNVVLNGTDLDAAIDAAMSPVEVQACRPEDRAMLATPEGAEMLAKAVAAISHEPPNAEVTGLGRTGATNDYRACRPRSG